MIFSIPSPPFLHPKIQLSWWGHATQEWGLPFQSPLFLLTTIANGLPCFVLCTALPRTPCPWAAVHSPSWDTLSLGCQVTIMQEEGRTRIPSCQCGDAIFAGLAQPPSCKFCGVVPSSSSPWSLADFCPSILRAGW